MIKLLLWVPLYLVLLILLTNFLSSQSVSIVLLQINFWFFGVTGQLFLDFSWTIISVFFWGIMTVFQIDFLHLNNDFLFHLSRILLSSLLNVLVIFINSKVPDFYPLFFNHLFILSFFWRRGRVACLLIPHFIFVYFFFNFIFTVISSKLLQIYL